MKNQHNYEFRKKLLEVHKKNVRIDGILPNENEIEITDGFVICTENHSDIVMNAAKDFAMYMLDSQNVSVMVNKKPVMNKNKAVIIRLKKDGEDLGNGNGYMGSKITITDECIEIVAYDERGAAQALYYLEDVMNLRCAPYLEKGVTERKTMFSPRMIHSGYGLDQYPDAHLSAIAHAGMDAILVFVKGVNLSPLGFMDFNELIHRAAKFGLDVYAYSYLKSEKHPEDEGAEEYYEGTYGKLFASCPGLKGVVLVGESVEFPSRDPHTTGRIGAEPADEVPSGKIRPGWWPCYDYPDWLRLVKRIIEKHNKDADIVFWSYNWGREPKEDRIKLIKSLPRDISLLVTYENAQIREFDGVKERVADYSLSFEGPGDYFLSEAEEAKKSGIRLYAMSNTGGLTWDFGVIPYEPFPYQWERRFNGVSDCHEKYGLCGLMESHHYGFYPSFISEFAKWKFTSFNVDNKDILIKILASRYGEENKSAVNSALEYWSEAIRNYIASNYDQYGPFRIGPAYPMSLLRKFIPKEAKHANFGNKILFPDYRPYEHGDAFLSSPSIRVNTELKFLANMDVLLSKGIEILDGINNPNDELTELTELGKYIRCCVRTAINTKNFVSARAKMDASSDTEAIKECLEKMEKSAQAEIENAKSAIPLVRHNSRLGWEPSMEYLGDAEHIEWKISQVEFMLNVELERFKKGVLNNPERIKS